MTNISPYSTCPKNPQGYHRWIDALTFEDADRGVALRKRCDYCDGDYVVFE